MPSSLYAYDPSTTVPLICCALFGLSTIVHLVQMIKKKTWFYTAMTVGGFMMTFGYTMRYLSAKDTSSIMLYAQQSLFIVLPPSLYAATMYMIFGRLVLFVNNPSASLIRPTRITKIFVIGDVISFLMQSGGGGMMVQSSTASLGEKVMLLGLAFQLLFFGFFLIIAITFRQRMLKSSFGNVISTQRGKNDWLKLLNLLLIGAGLIIARCIFRVAEFGMGREGLLMSKEVFLYIGDAAPMFVVQVLFHFKHAGNVFEGEFEGGKGYGMGDESYVYLSERV